jgi:23S rRNA (guanosine2251-2'-O)-methyltransferase
LAQKKEINEAMETVVGIHAVRSALRDSATSPRCLYVLQGRRDARINELIGLSRDRRVRYQVVARDWFENKNLEVNHQGVLLEMQSVKMMNERDFKDWCEQGEIPKLFLIVDGMTDPRNLGACLRSANAAGVDAVLLPKRRIAPLSSTVMRVAQGGCEELSLVELGNIARTLKWLQERGVWIIGADVGGGSIWESNLDNRPVALVVGDEGKGLRRLTKELCDEMAGIPMFGTVESLNVSVATGVLLFELRRKKARIPQA